MPRILKLRVGIRKSLILIYLLSGEKSRREWEEEARAKTDVEADEKDTEGDNMAEPVCPSTW